MKPDLSTFTFVPFSVKQKKTITWWMPQSPFRDHDGIICDGSIRSGKTIAFIVGFIQWSTAKFAGQNFIISGKTIGSLKRNVIGPMLRILHSLGIPYEYNRGENCIRFSGNSYYLFGADKEDSQDRVQGITAAGWLADEVALHHPEFITQALGRLLSIPGSKFWWNCNPESPYHVVKTDYLDKADTKRIFHLHFTLDDNPSLAPSAKERAFRTFSGVWFKRYILGLWVAAEGAIYDMLDDAIHVVDLPEDQPGQPFIVKHWVGVDYGTGSVTAFWLLGLGRDNRLYFVDFWRWDAGVKASQRSDPQFAQDMEDWLAQLAVVPESVVVPEDAASFLVYLQQNSGKFAHIKHLAVADRSPGSVLDGIRNVGSLLTSRLLFFSKQVRDKQGLLEWNGYVWDPKAQERGEDKPLKDNDHDPDACRYVIQHTRHIWYKFLRKVG